MKYIATLIMMLVLIIALFSCSKPVSIVLLVDQTDSTKNIRANKNVKKLCDAIKARPNYTVKMLGMMPDRLYPLSLENLNKSYGVNKGENGVKYTGGDLEGAIEKVTKIASSDIYVIITDGENNFGNVEHGVPDVPPGRYIFVGIDKEKWQSYANKGHEVYTLDEVPNLLRSIVMYGRL